MIILVTYRYLLVNLSPEIVCVMKNYRLPDQHCVQERKNTIFFHPNNYFDEKSCTLRIYGCE